VISSQSIAEAFYTKTSSVEAFSIRDDGIRVKLSEMENPGQTCATLNDWYMISSSSPFIDQAYSAILSSKVSSQKINFQINGCVSYGDRFYPKIAQVYFCDTKLCG